MMTNSTTLPRDSEEQRHAIVQELYDRLQSVQHNMACHVNPDDFFEQGIDCRLANEEMWLLQLLDKIERS
jgi:hypothetical protein